MVENKVTSI